MPALILLLSIIISLIAASIFVIAGDAGCCCNGNVASPNTFVNRESCSFRFVIPGSRQLCPEVCGGGTPSLNLSAPNCNQQTFSPKIKTIDKVFVQGKRQLTLVWSADCAAEYYNISRCESRICNFKTLGATSNNYFTDESDELLFDTEYTYRVTGYFRAQDKSSSLSINTTIGSLECFNRNANTPFCIQRSYYSQYAAYLITKKGFTQSNFNNEVINLFSSRFNKAYSCNENNVLSSPSVNCNSGTSDCFTGQACTCIADASGPRCAVNQNCANLSNNPFGLFADKAKCEGTASSYRYCFYDKSATVVNTCYNCNPNMDCYDYKTKAACESDNCNTGRCSWKDTISSLGVGVCVNLDTENCNWCIEKGTQGSPTVKVHNAVFDTCTAEKSAALSTDAYPCFFKNGESLSCEKVTCTDYTNEECLTFAPVALDPTTNTLSSKSNDKCRIGVCSSVFGACSKNADYSPNRDCNSAACESDYFAPDTQIVATGFEEGIPTQFIIDITDKTEKVGLPRRVGSGYTTYLCHLAAAACNDGSTFPLNISGTFLLVNNLKMFDGTRHILTLQGGENILKFYTRDPANNLGIIKTITFNASPNVSGPVPLAITVSNSKVADGVYFTNSKRPMINVTFSDYTILTFSGLAAENATVPFTTQPLENNSKYLFLPDAELPDGIYNFTLSARNNYGKLMKSPLKLVLAVDHTPPQFTASPINTTLRNANVVITLNFTKEVDLAKVQVNGEMDIKNRSSTHDNRSYAIPINLSDGSKQVLVEASDYAGNTVSGSFSFVVNAVPTVITLLLPKTGVSKDSIFNITVGTDNDAACRYVLDLENVVFQNMKPFTVTGGISHTITNFNEIPDGDQKEHKLYVKCDDGLSGIREKAFRIAIDKTPPIILSAFAQPDPIIESDLRTVLKVQTDDNTVCRYDAAKKGYTEMDEEFIAPDIYQKIHSQNYTALAGQPSYTFFIACENEAGLLSNTSSIRFSINLSAPLAIQVNTPRYSNSSTVILDISTNKRAQCYFGQAQEAITNLFGDLAYRHQRAVSGISPGIPQTYYARCIVGGLFSSVVQIQFTVDATPPAMLYVNDTSALPNDPEFTFLTDSLRVKWLGQENESSISYYRYSLEAVQPSRETIINQSVTSIAPDKDFLVVNKDNSGRPLNLTDKARYIFRVDATNIVGITGKAMESDGITVDVSKKPTHCSNLVKDDDETDLDCGGSCVGCGENATCGGNSDCETGFCDPQLKQCKTQSCNDGARNGQETDIDCGSACPTKCALDRQCISSRDCISGNCEFGSCKKPTPCSNGILDQGEGDIDCGTYCPLRCSAGRQCNIKEDCTPESDCIHQKCVQLEPDEDADGIPDSRDNCPSTENKEQEDLDKDAVGDACDDDIDGDGLQNEWEDLHNLDKFAADSDGNGVNDGEEDFDSDQLNNIEEQRARTDPYREDTDADAYSDSVELDAGTDPLDPESYPSSNFFSYLIYAAALLLIISGLAMGYRKYGQNLKTLLRRKPKSAYKYTPTAPSSASSPVQQSRQTGKSEKPVEATSKHKLFELRMKEKLKTRTGLLDIFTGGSQPDSSQAKPKGQEKPEKQAKVEEAKPAKGKEEQKTSKAEAKQQKPAKQDPFSKLDTIIKKRQKR